MKISFREVTIDDAKMILDWRTSPGITQQMITDIPYDLDAQRKWIVDSYSKKDYYNWVILCDDTPIGCIYIQNFNFENAQTYWGFYKGSPGFPGVGSKIEAFLYNWLFFQVGIKNIFTEVFYSNVKVIDLHLSYGYKFMPEKDRVIYKNGREILMVSLSLPLQDWDKEKYKDSISSFPTNHWKYSPV